MAIAVGPNVLDVTNAQVSMQESVVTDGQGSELDMAQDRHPEALRPTQVAENEDDKGLESQDEFEDAEEDMPYKPKEESTESQQERISRLMGQKMVQGWTMMQETCPNPACNGVGSIMYPLLGALSFHLSWSNCPIAPPFPSRCNPIYQNMHSAPPLCHFYEGKKKNAWGMVNGCMLLRIEKKKKKI